MFFPVYRVCEKPLPGSNVIRVSSPCPYLLLGEVGFPRYHEKRSFLRLTQEDEILKMALFLWNFKALGFQGSLFLHPTVEEV